MAKMTAFATLTTLLTHSCFWSDDDKSTTRCRITRNLKSKVIMGNATIMAWPRKSFCMNEVGHTFITNTNELGISTYELIVSVKPLMYFMQKTAILRPREGRPCADAVSAANKRSCIMPDDDDLVELRASYKSYITKTAATAKRLLNNANVGKIRAEGVKQEPGHILQGALSDNEICVNEAIWNWLTRFCCCDDSDVQ